MGSVLTVSQSIKSKTNIALLVLVAGPQIWQLIQVNKAVLQIPDIVLHWMALGGGIIGIIFRIWNTQGSNPSVPAPAQPPQ